MSGRITRNLVITAPDGTEVTDRTAGDYTVAGIIQGDQGTWRAVAHGWSHESVARRTAALYRRGCYRSMHTGTLTEATAPVIREYFGTHHVAIDAMFRPDLEKQHPQMKPGWAYPWDAGYTTRTQKLTAGQSMIRQLARDGWTALTFRLDTRQADFQMDELLKSMNARKSS